GDDRVPCSASSYRNSDRCRFFFQAEDGIRDKLVTGVQTCALPISLATSSGTASAVPPAAAIFAATVSSAALRRPDTITVQPSAEIGRASCRERVESSVRAVLGTKEETRSWHCRNDAGRSRMVLRRD